MFDSFQNKASRLVFTLLLSLGSAAAVAAQPVYSRPNPTPTPFYQPIVVPTPTAPLVRKTGGVTPASSDVVNPADASAVAIPGVSGVLVETADGKVVKESYSNYAFNPASNVKVATAYAVLKTFGPNYRFSTNVFADGTIDKTTGTLYGNLYVSGRDPIFTHEHGVALAETLNRMGVRQVNGDLVVTDKFVMSYSESSVRSAQTLFATLNTMTRSSAAVRSWQEYLSTSGKAGQMLGAPSVMFTGKVYVDILPTNAKLLFSHESAPLREIVKVTMCYSNNFLAERLGDMLGGAYAVARVVQLNTQTAPEEFILQTSSGLGVNRVTPRAMMRLLRTFKNELARYKMTFADVMPIAGIDPGTLQKRFNTYSSVGSVVGKTGTLGNTDGGASSLAGEMQTRKGKLLFVIFNQRGNNARFRNFQNSFVSMIQNEYGGAASLGYSSTGLAFRLANTRITYPDSRARIN